MDSHGDPNAANIARDQIDCHVLAKQAAGNPAIEVGKGILVGGATDAAAGSLGVDNQYKKAFVNCMRGRGHNVL